jgi:hypothetical protein
MARAMKDGLGARRMPGARSARRLELPLKEEYGPTLGQLLAPRWRGARRWMRWAALVGGAVIVAVLVALALALRSATISHAGSVPFSFSYKGLYKTSPDPGGYAKVERRQSGRLADSFAVEPLVLPPYAGSVTGEFPLYARGYIRALAAQYPHFQLVGEGPIRTSAFGSWEELPPSTIYYHVPTYTIAFKALLEGREIYGREVFLVPDKAGARDGVDLRMLTSARTRGHASSPLSVGTAGVLSRPMRTFSLGG